VIILGSLVMLAEVLTSNLNYLAQSLSRYQPYIDSIVARLDTLTGLDIKKSAKTYSGNLDFGSIFQQLFASISGLLSNGFLVIIYALFVLLEESHFGPKLQAIFIEKGQRSKIDGLLAEISSSISSYFKLKTLVSLVTGTLSYIALRMIGVDAPEFWAFLIFILNFIPTIGSLIATLFPAAFCLFQFGAFLPPILVLVIVGLIQLFVGNFLEPKLMGSSMNISPLVTIISLSIWGAIWGIIGMILSVPITVITIIILSKFEKTRPIAILLSEKGKIAK
jgi:predicted PurR-regulated permease PerM